MRKFVVGATAFGLMGLAACGSSSTSGSAAPGSTAIKVWIMGSSATNFEKLLKPFTSSTGVNVSVQSIPWANVNEKLTTAVASGNGPDITQVGLSQLPDFISSGALMDIGSQVAKDPVFADSNFISGFASANLNPSGKVLSVPWISDTRVLFYRSDILAQAGISSPPTTLAQMQADAVKLAARGSGKYGYYIPQWDNPLPIEFAWSMGGGITDANGKVDFNTPAFKQAVDYYDAYYKQKLVPTASDFDQTVGLISGSAPMLISGPYEAQSLKTEAPQLAGKWAVAPIPTGTSSTALLAGSTIGVWKNSKNVSADMKLLDFLEQPSTQVQYYNLDGDLPSTTAALNNSSLTSDPNVQVYVKALQTAKLLPLVPAWDKIQTDMLNDLNKIVLSGADETSMLSQLNTDVAGLQN